MEKKINAKHGESPRARKRTVGTREKTARACGRNYAPVTPWRQRKQAGDY